MPQLTITSVILRIAASLCLCAGLALLYWRWRDREAGRAVMWGGWGLVVAGLAAWTLAGHADVFLSDATVIVMVVAAAIIIGHAFTLAPPSRQPRPRAQSDNDGLELGRGYWSRAVARLLGCVAVAPAMGLMAGTLWRAYVPGNEADTIMMMAVIACLVTAGAWVMQLASTRPWRAFVGLSIASLAIASAIYLPMGLHS